MPVQLLKVFSVVAFEAVVAVVVDFVAAVVVAAVAGFVVIDFAIVVAAVIADYLKTFSGCTTKTKHTIFLCTKQNNYENCSSSFSSTFSLLSMMLFHNFLSHSHMHYKVTIGVYLYIHFI